MSTILNGALRSTTASTYRLNTLVNPHIASRNFKRPYSSRKMDANAPEFYPRATVGSPSARRFVHPSTLTVPTRVEKPLRWEDGPMVWIDCEMTGLDPKSDQILEIAVLITNGNLDIVDEQGICYIIKTEKQVLDNMNEWCIKQHGLSGLTAQCLASPHTQATVKQAVLDYVKSWIPNKGVGILAGSSVHADRGFLVEEMPELVDHLHYRIIDVSSIKELCRRWYPGASNRRTESRKTESNHRALDDIRGSIQELKWYREHIFVPPEQSSPDGQRL